MSKVYIYIYLMLTSERKCVSDLTYVHTVPRLVFGDGHDFSTFGGSRRGVYVYRNGGCVSVGSHRNGYHHPKPYVKRVYERERLSTKVYE